VVPCFTTKNSTISNSTFPWLRLPPTPDLPLPRVGHYAQINNISIWYTIYGPDNGIPLLFLHGGFANSDYWGLQIKELKSVYRCILMDSRGQGRSSMSSTNITYDLMTSDVVALLDYLDISKTHLVGWSDGAIIGLSLAMKYSGRLKSLFAFGGNYAFNGTKDIFASPAFNAYLNRTEMEYKAMNPFPDYLNLRSNLMTMWASSPDWSRKDFEQIDNSLPVWIVDGDHEEAILREQTDTMASWIPQSGELILPKTSHFAFIQDPESFTLWVNRFLIEANGVHSNEKTMLQSSTGIVLCTIFFHFSS
jgi:pimeloyl-ACP methyl ester carboxylesterase